MSTEPLGVVEEYAQRQHIRPRLYNASDDHYEHQYSGIFYVFGPQDELEIGDRLTFRRDERGKPLVKKALVLDGKEGEGRATEIVKVLLQRCGDYGITVLYGDEDDEQRKTRARDRWLAFKIGQCRLKQREWLLKVERSTREPGAVPPAQPKDVREALTFLERYERGLIGRKQFISKVDGAEFDSFEECKTHNERRWSSIVGSKPEDHVIDTHAGLEGAPKGEVKPPPEPKAPEHSVDMAYLLDCAQKAGVQLEAAEFAGLLRKDQKIADRVIEKVSMAMAKPKSRSKSAQKEAADGEEA